MAIDIGKIRNVGVVGHGGVGKTSLVESMLFAAGAVNRLGKVDDGSTTTDFDPDEIKRKISINTTVAYCDYKGHRINLVDTPGYGDLIADALAADRPIRTGLHDSGASDRIATVLRGHRDGPDRSPALQPATTNIAAVQLDSACGGLDHRQGDGEGSRTAPRLVFGVPQPDHQLAGWRLRS